MGGKGLITDDASVNEDCASGDSRNTGEAESEAVLPESSSIDPDLALVVAAWPSLPSAIRAQIVAMVLRPTD